MLTPMNYLNCKFLVEEWINNHKPDQTTSKLVCDEFMNQVEIRGSPEFKLKVKKIIEKTSHLASGITILQRLLHTKESLSIFEGNANFCRKKEMSLSFQKAKSFGVTRNSEGDPQLVKLSKISIFIHECLHHWHSVIDPKAESERLKSESYWPEMHDQEEELAITGNGHVLDEKTDYCCENTALIELGRSCRINHQGIYIKKGEVVTLHDMVSVRAIADVKKALRSHPEAKHYNEHIPTYGKQTPLDMALCLKAREGDVALQKEWLELINLLIKAGFKSDEGYKIAILENSLELVKLFIEAGITPLEEMLRMAVDKGSYYKEIEELEALLTQRRYLPSCPSMESNVVRDPHTHDILRAKYDRALRLFNQKFFGKTISLELIKQLVEAGAKPTAEIVHKTIYQESLEILHLFIDTGWKPSKETWKYVIERYRSEVIELFLEKGVEPPVDALEMAIGTKDLKMATLLIHKGKMKPHDTLLIFAAQRRDSKMIEFLIKEGLTITKELIERAKKEKFRPHILLNQYLDQKLS